MRFALKMFAVVLGLWGLGACVVARAQQTGGRVVLVLPFDNRSGNPSLNWIGDSFPDTLDKRLTSVGFLTLSRDDRTFAYTHLGLPEGFKPSRATAIKIAQQLDANQPHAPRLYPRNTVVRGSKHVASPPAHIRTPANSPHQQPPAQPSQCSQETQLPRGFHASNAASSTHSKINPRYARTNNLRRPRQHHLRRGVRPHHLLHSAFGYCR